MTKEEIRSKILFNNNKIQELLDPTTFIYQPEVKKYMAENEKLQSQCPHEISNGVCTICGKIFK